LATEAPRRRVCRFVAAAAASRVAARRRRDDRDPRGDGATPVSLLENRSRARIGTRRSSRARLARDAPSLVSPASARAL
jgi:hypothetical protein